jgi:predicted outer membrane repeat protein
MKHQHYQLTSRPGSTALHGTSRSLLLSTVFLLLVFKTTPGYGNEWNCLSTSGTYVKSADCAPMAGEVIVDGDLSITGNENTYTTLVAASAKRHFKVNGAHTLTLNWLNITGGSASGNNDGGSIYIYNFAGHLNITHCVFYKNYAGSEGGAIYARDDTTKSVVVSLTNTQFVENSVGESGAAVDLEHGRLNSLNVQYVQNTAEWGGALCLKYMDGTINDDLFTMNEAVKKGGGIWVFGTTSTPSRLNISRTIFKYNKQTTGSDADFGGGGIFIYYYVVMSIRESAFIKNTADNNNQGHHFMTYKTDSHGNASTTLVNTNFTNIDGTANNSYGYDGDVSAGGTDKYISPNGCSSNPCTVPPFTGTCSVRTNANYGALCGRTDDCPSGEFREEVSESILPPPVTLSCFGWTSCTAGNYVSANGSATSDRVCNSCGSGKFTNASNLNECLNWTECESSEIIIVNGSNTADRICGVGTTTTEAPSTTTTTGNTTTTSSGANATATKGNQLSGAIRSKRYWLSPTFVTVAWCFLF